MTAVVHSKVRHLTPKAIEAFERFRGDFRSSACPVVDITKTTITFKGKPADVADAIYNFMAHGLYRHAPVKRSMSPVAHKLRAYSGASDRHVQVTAFSTGPAVPPPAPTPFYED